MDLTQHIGSIITVIITMVVTIFVKAFWDWATNKNGKEALKELKANFDTFKTDDLIFKNKLLQDLNELKYKYTGRDMYDSHLNLCTVRTQEYKEGLSDLKQELAIIKNELQTYEQRISKLENRI